MQIKPNKTTTSVKQKTIGLALGSGGIRGLAHIGVIKTLLKHGLTIDYLAGSSIGAWVAAHYALYQDIDKLEEYTVYKKKEKFHTFLEPTLKGGLIKGDKLEKLLNNWLANADFIDTKIPVQITATDLLSAQTITFSQGKLATAVHASMAVPTLFKPVEYKNKILIDGGTSNPVPDNLLHAIGAEVVISVNLDNYQKNSYFTAKDLTLKKTASRSLDIMRYHLAHYSINNSDIIIEPYLPKINMSSWRKYFQKKNGPEIVKIGEEETEKVIDKIKNLVKKNGS